jgi:hypothetical protein
LDCALCENARADEKVTAFVELQRAIHGEFARMKFHQLGLSLAKSIAPFVKPRRKTIFYSGLRVLTQFPKQL